MKQLNKVIEALHTSRYLSASIDVNGSINNCTLLLNGIKYSEQLLKHWRRQHSLDKEVPNNFVDVDGVDTSFDIINRHNFIFSKQFIDGVKHLCSKFPTQPYPAILKTVQNVHVHSNQGAANDFSVSTTKNRTYLITDYLTHPAKGFSDFFNSQRECKIWWMRFSTDPSKYYLDPYKFNNISESTFPPGTQSITIKSKLPYVTLDVESLTFVPLLKHHLDESLIDLFSNNKNCQDKIPAVIRSVIDLQAATSAVLIDSVDNERESSLLLNRKLAPYQCVVACYHQGKKSKDLEDLCLHINYVLSRSGLRLMKENTIFTESLDKLDEQLYKYDSLGIPYALIINENTLQNGLLKLRSRDTTLEETIHISDLPDYLLQIFSN
ncbi:DNA polymerase subunit gamma-2, mitochondrial [Zeugodacus cucurbitae]|uniref:DNA polymerase subunit gamma-2, mitochondrial n=1 Tax=Zeugodacus cucurbitae TaxID=28588 RepID=UPI0023D9470B|nr:DNA polymerase subunit gamma-2, mitochondrial [Zeugodacus cucurbitae]